MFTGDFQKGKAAPTPRGEIRREFFARRSESSPAICSQHEIPQFHAPPLLVQVRENNILRRQRRKGMELLEQNAGFHRRVEHQMHMRLTAAWPAARATPDSAWALRGSTPGRSTKSRSGGCSGVAPEPFHGHADHFALQRKKFRRVRSLAVQPPDARPVFSRSTASVIHLHSTVVLPEPAGPTNTCGRPVPSICCRAGLPELASVSRTTVHSAIGIGGGSSPCAAQTFSSNKSANAGSKPSDSSQEMLCQRRGAAIHRQIQFNLVAKRHISILAGRNDVLFLRLLRHAGDDFDVSGMLPQPRNAGSRQFAHAHHNGVRSQLLLDLRQRGVRVFGDDGDNFMSSFCAGDHGRVLHLHRAAEFPRTTARRDR